MTADETTGRDDGYARAQATSAESNGDSEAPGSGECCILGAPPRPAPDTGVLLSTTHPHHPRSAHAPLEEIPESRTVPSPWVGSPFLITSVMRLGREGPGGD